MASALDGVGVQRHALAALPPGMTWYPLYGRLGGPQGRSGRVRKISPPTGFRSPYRSARSVVAIPTELSGGEGLYVNHCFIYSSLMLERKFLV